ncbi:MAG: nucleoside-diphosphate sugar epimerase/dehydratase [Pseudomonadota bacterium]
MIDLSREQKTFILLLVDLALIPISFYVTTLINGTISPGLMMADPSDTAIVLGTMIFAGLVASLGLGLPRIKLNAYEQKGILRTAAFATIVGMAGGVALHIPAEPLWSWGVLIIFTMVLIILAVSARITMRSILVDIYTSGLERQRVLIYGAGQTGLQLAAALGTDDAVEPVAFVDDNPTFHKLTVAGLPVHAPVRIEELIKEKLINRVVLAMPSISRPKQARIARRLQDVGCEVSVLPSFATLVGEGKLLDQVQPLNPSDYLNREDLDDALPGVCDIYAGRSIMITGAGGSIGSELTRQVLRCAPSRIVLFEISEFALYQLNRELLEIAPPGVEVVPVMGSVTDPDGVRRAIQDNKIDIIFHAAAYKHVPLVEQNKLAGLRNNVMGTRIVAEAASDLEVSHFILISTDKAVRPSNVMGASKRFAELLVQDLATRSDKTRFAMVRFGNVLGSSGSVVPLFEEQIARGGPVTLTHVDVTRFFMTLSEAARLVLLSGSYSARSDSEKMAEVYVLDMGAPVPILRLARQMIEGAGYTVCDAANPDGDIEIIITGLRPGEKLHEQLTMSGHALEHTVHPKILRANEPYLSQIEVAAALKSLSRAIEEGDESIASDTINRWIGPLPDSHETSVQDANPDTAT